MNNLYVRLYFIFSPVGCLTSASFKSYIYYVDENLYFETLLVSVLLSHWSKIIYCLLIFFTYSLRLNILLVGLFDKGMFSLVIY